MKITSTILLYDWKNKPYLQILLEDGSYWNYNTLTDKFTQISPNTQELEAKLNPKK